MAFHFLFAVLDFFTDSCLAFLPQTLQRGLYMVQNSCIQDKHDEHFIQLSLEDVQ